MNKKKALCALGMLILFGAAMAVFIIAADEQSVLSSGSPAADRIRLQDLISRGAGKNKHIELGDFYFGKGYVYASKAVQFTEVYVPAFAKGQAENGGNLHVLVWIRDDRNSNQRLIESPQDLDQFVMEFNRSPATITGVLREPIQQVRTLTAEAYPGTNPATLQVLWARNFPDQTSVNLIWAISAVLLVAAIVCAIAYRRMPRS